MPIEIERKFLVVNESWRSEVAEVHWLRQGYLTKNDRISIRVRLRDEDAASLTIKSASAGIERDEYEYPIPVADALELLRRCEGVIISKRRHMVHQGDLIWEIDVFDGENEGLIIAEIELPNAETAFAQPQWLGKEVTSDRRYYNADLSRRPYTAWFVHPQ